MLKGTMYITDNEDVVYNIPKNSNTKIVSLDEDGVLINDPNNTLVGTCLLPPVEAMIAEADGNEMLYDSIYGAHLLDTYQQQFISALLSFLYLGGNLVLFLPELGMNTRKKLVFHLYQKYGIHPGVIGEKDPNVANWYVDMKCVPLWLNMIYSVHAISAQEYLYMYPEDAVINNKFVIEELLKEIKPYEDTIQDKINNILKLHKLIHKNPNVINPIEEVMFDVDVW